MQAILKGKHQRFCKWLQSIRDRLVAPDPPLEKLEEEMLAFYEMYQQQREELRKIITEYEVRQQGLRNRIKGFKKQDYKALNSVRPIMEKPNEKSIAV